MLNKIGFLFLSESKLQKYFNISNKLFILGIISLLFFPLFSTNLNIIEKFYKNSVRIKTNLSLKEFQESYKEYTDNINNNYNLSNDNELLQFVCSPFINKISKIYTKNINSLRGAKRKFMMINLIYENTKSSQKANGFFYAFMKYLSDKRNIQWLSKDIQFNYISNQMFYEDIYNTYNALTSTKNKKIENGEKLEDVININLNKFDLENIHKILIQINGINSECLDLDVYSVYAENFFESFNDQNIITTNKKIISKNEFKILHKLLYNIGSSVSYFYSKFDVKSFISKYIYLINNLLYNYLHIENKINLNNLFISNNYNSVLLQIIEKKEIYNNDINDPIKFRNNYYFINALERILKIYSKNEIDNFRGEFFYIITSNQTYIGYLHLIPAILLIIRGFYEIINCIYLIEYKFINTENKESVNASKIISVFFIIYTISIGILLHFDIIQSVIKIKNNYECYLYILVAIFILQFTSLIFLNLNDNSMIFINNIIRLFLLVNTWNFSSYNIGILFFMYIFILPLEQLIIYLQKNNKRNLFIFIAYVSLLYFILGYKNLIDTMTKNYILYKNSDYLIISIILCHLSYRLALYLYSLIKNKFYIK